MQIAQVIYSRLPSKHLKKDRICELTCHSGLSLWTSSFLTKPPSRHGRRRIVRTFPTPQYFFFTNIITQRHPGTMAYLILQLLSRSLKTVSGMFSKFDFLQLLHLRYKRNHAIEQKSQQQWEEVLRRWSNRRGCGRRHLCCRARYPRCPLLCQEKENRRFKQ